MPTPLVFLAVWMRLSISFWTVGDEMFSMGWAGDRNTGFPISATFNTLRTPTSPLRTVALNFNEKFNEKKAARSLP